MHTCFASRPTPSLYNTDDKLQQPLGFPQQSLPFFLPAHALMMPCLPVSVAALSSLQQEAQKMRPGAGITTSLLIVAPFSSTGAPSGLTMVTCPYILCCKTCSNLLRPASRSCSRRFPLGKRCLQHSQVRSCRRRCGHLSFLSHIVMWQSQQP